VTRATGRRDVTAEHDAGVGRRDVTAEHDAGVERPASRGA